jgi:DNA-binding transcriptional ArsR family regulator
MGLPAWITYNHMVVGYPLTDEETDRIFHALGAATRRDILERAIREEQPQSVSALARQYSMSFAAVQKHVAVLERAGLVIKVPRGREQIVHVQPETIRKATALLATYEQLWIGRVARIADILANDEGSGT